LILLSPESIGTDVGAVPTLILGPASGHPNAGGRHIVYGGVGPGFWDDASPDFAPAAGRDALRRIVEFLDRHLIAVAAA
jgi:hypothetical protein